MAPPQPSFHRGGNSQIIIVSLLIIALIMNPSYHSICQILIVDNKLREKEKKTTLSYCFSNGVTHVFRAKKEIQMYPFPKGTAISKDH